MAEPHTLTVATLDERLRDLVYWESFGIQLKGIEYTDIETIKRNHPADIAGQKLALYHKWLTVCTDATWSDVDIALAKTNKFMSAEQANIASGLRYDRPYEAVALELTVATLDEQLSRLVDWEKFGLQLRGVKNEDIETIKKNHPADNAGQRLALYHKWLTVCPDASWSDVVIALEKAGEYTLAEHIKIRQHNIGPHDRKEVTDGRHTDSEYNDDRSHRNNEVDDICFSIGGIILLTEPFHKVF